MDTFVKPFCPESDIPTCELPVQNMDATDNFLAKWRARYEETHRTTLSQEKLGDEIGVSHQTIGRIEARKQGIKLKHLSRMGEFFGVPRWAIIEIDPSTDEGKLVAEMLEAWERIDPPQRQAAVSQMQAFAASYPVRKAVVARS